MKKVCLISLERSAAGRNLRPAGSEGVIMYRKSHAVRTFLCLLLTFVFMTVFSAQPLLAASDQKPSVAWPEAPAINSGAACLMDADTNAILFGANMDEQRYPASITKVMTALLVAENKQPADQVTFGEQAVSESIPGNARINVQLGETISVEDALHAILLASANEVCTQLAIDIAGSVEAFVKMMNEKAEELGLTKTHFVTPNGLDGEDEGGVHATTAMELAKIMKYCIMDSPEKEMFLDITGTKEYHFRDLKGTSSYTCTNHNAFLTMMDGAISGKTGFTADAGYCYVGALRRDERTFIVALLACGWPNHKGYKWSDTKKLMEYGLSNYEYRNVWQELPKQEIVVKDSGNDQNIYQKNSVAEVEIQQKPEVLKVLLRTDENVEISVQMEKALSAPAEKGQKVGEVRYIIDKNIIGKYDVLTRSGLKKRTFSWCLKRCMERFFGYTRWNTFFVDLR